MNLPTEQKPYELMLGNCLEKMKDIPDGSIDAIICDLPYGTTKNSWDVTLPFPQLWEHYHRVAKPEAAIVLFAQGLFASQLALSNSKHWRYNLVWEKDRPSGILNSKRMPLRSHEDIIIFYRKLPVYNPQMTEGKPSHSIGSAEGEAECKNNNNYGKFARINREGTLKYPRSVLRYPRPHPPVHPTQKPVGLIEYLIKTYTNEGQIVLDNTMGSGTTGVACANTNRRFIGIEMDQVYFDIAQKRIESAFLERMAAKTVGDGGLKNA